ncbi:Methionyl-tRNA formyltransferase [Cladophialophora chaetospira]|uniref:methionyl-tRNA formyltransferase n=1 Tax=Cladophialophora chaetospira TaxID=386627 RepID=A0AA39CGK9_9EURO|nr:Methionyl-tRNA formyltransferase [Cladophialophora chaetospira]
MTAVADYNTGFSQYAIRPTGAKSQPHPEEEIYFAGRLRIQHTTYAISKRMTRLLTRAVSFSRGQLRPSRWRCNFAGIHRRFYSQKAERDEPLRILFCGTDSFSKESLLQLHDYSQTPESNILSIDVVTRTDKRVGRGRKTVKPPEIKIAAEKLGLPVHQIDTFTGWQPPSFGGLKDEHCNLIIAVSFGRLIPPRILGTAKYGGLNIHPSLLPDLRGPAPIEWTILLGRRNTGVSLQTLHPSRFDEGSILTQTPRPGLEIPNADGITSSDLESYLAPIGAKMLVDALRDKLYIPPYSPVQLDKDSPEPLHAPKLNTAFRVVDFKAVSCTEILRRNRACGPLHAFTPFNRQSKHTGHIKFDTSLRALKEGEIPEEVQAAVQSIPEGLPYAIIWSHENISESSAPLIVNGKADRDEECRQLVIPQITVGGLAPGSGAGAAGRAKLFSKPENFEPFKLYRFSQPLVTQSSLTDTTSAVTSP